MGTMGGGFGGKGQKPGMSGEDTAIPDNTSKTREQVQQLPDFTGQGNMTPPDGMGMPVRMENPFPGQNGSSQEGFPGRDQTGSASTLGGNQRILLVSTIIILAAGLLFVFKFKR